MWKFIRLWIDLDELELDLLSALAYVKAAQQKATNRESKILMFQAGRKIYKCLRILRKQVK